MFSLVVFEAKIRIGTINLSIKKEPWNIITPHFEGLKSWTSANRTFCFFNFENFLKSIKSTHVHAMIETKTIRIERPSIKSVYLFLKTECFLKYREIISIAKVVLIVMKFSNAYQIANVMKIIWNKTYFKMFEYFCTNFHFDEINTMSQIE